MRSFLFLSAAVVGAAVAFFAGRLSVPSLEPVSPAPALTTLPTIPAHTPAMSGQPDLFDGHADLLRTLAQPAGERASAARLALLSCLATDGAAAIIQSRDDPEIVDQFGAMVRMALMAYPELFLEDPSLLDGLHGSEQFIASTAQALSSVEPEIAKKLLSLQFPDWRDGEAVVYLDDQFLGGPNMPLTANDAHAELDAILAEDSFSKRIARTYALVGNLATTDPAAAAALVDRLPASLRQQAVPPFISRWAEASPMEAAQWLANQPGQIARQGMVQLGRHWGMQDFQGADAYLDAQTGPQRRSFLDGLASATHAMPSHETLAWIARFEGDPDYSKLVQAAVQSLAQKDLSAARSLIEALPEAERQNSNWHMASALAMTGPEAATAEIERIQDEQSRDQLISAALPMWTMFDPEWAELTA